MTTPPPPPNDQPQQPTYGQQPPYGQQPYSPPPQYAPPSQPFYGPPPGYAPPPPPPPGASSQWGPSSIGMEPNIAAGLGYLIGIIAIIFYFIEKQNRFVKFHTAQAILMYIINAVVVFVWVFAFFAASLGLGAVASDTTDPNAAAFAGFVLILLTLCFGLFVLGFLAVWIWGMVAAFTGRVVKFPIIGAIAERWAGGPVIPVAPFGPMASYAPPPPPPPPGH